MASVHGTNRIISVVAGICTLDKKSKKYESNIRVFFKDVDVAKATKSTGRHDGRTCH